MAKTSDSWDALPEDTKAPTPTYNKGAKFNVESIPAVIRDRAESLMTVNEKKERDFEFRRQECGTPERAAEFLKLMKKYCDYRPADKGGPLTLRLRDVVKGKLPEGQTFVTYCVKPREVRETKKA